MKNFILCLFLVSVLACKEENSEKQQNIEAPKGMVWVPTKTFLQGAKDSDKMAMMREKPAHKVKVDGFFIDKTEVTNKEFKAFVDATGYLTLAEKAVDWNELKQQLPQGTLKPHDSLLAPGSLIFNKDAGKVDDLNNYQQWWTWQLGADWQHPQGPDSNIDDKDNYPVVHIAYEDAVAYCKWANRRLPTEAEWESAALGKQDNSIFTWGNNADKLNDNANTWQGKFPISNLGVDGYESLAPVKSFPPNSIGIYDMLGNAWELTSDLFDVNYYKQLDKNKVYENPKVSTQSYSPDNPYEVQHVIKGGSFLCHESYCASFRISARMGNAIKSSSDHVTFRTVATPEMLDKKKSE